MGEKSVMISIPFKVIYICIFNNICLNFEPRFASLARTLCQDNGKQRLPTV